MTTLTEKQLSAILKRPGYSITEPTKRTRPAQLDSALPQGSKHEVKFVQIWGWLQGPALDREVKFCNRGYRFDFCHKATMTAIEIEGFGHQKSNRYNSDILKYNESSKLGWVLFRLTSDMITINKLQEIIEFIRSKEQAT